ncbi:pyrroline-5-carboxylate reductase [Brochothrix campestris]|uniref:Pyrroline-5-carboxylate reductase n=1 Tax=Brochothrix campestris FSL F6-1037 TaxID=1265861 RepID=W7CTA6_9LIST|nr:pyrroline-5-carboxylate reductase [Brochothrix campestris]EUJ40142.1 pyrroline-5-carboxylate reductase [Brochothrix campestris FSL F6-1037]
MTQLGFIGVGNMGGAIIEGLLTQPTMTAANFIMSGGTGPRTKALQQKTGIKLTTNKDVAAMADILVLGVKPIIMPSVLAEIKTELLKSPQTLIITIAGSLTIASYEEQLSTAIKLVRIMPNTPVSVGEGMMSIVPNQNVSAAELATVEALFAPLGQTVVIEERLMDVTAALAGSAPALIDMFIESLADGAVAKGLPRQLAYDMATQTLIGSAKLMQVSKLHPGELKDQVCSPGGTTIEAVKTLEKHNFRYAVIDAIGRCVDKAKE